MQMKQGLSCLIEYLVRFPSLPSPCSYRIISQTRSVLLFFFFPNMVCVDECFRLSDGLGVRMVGGVNEIVDTLGVNEGLEGES